MVWLCQPRAGIGLLLAVMLSNAGNVAAQAQPWEEVGTFVEDGPLQSADDLTGRCPARPVETCAYRYPVLSETCEVRATKELGRFGPDQYLAIGYLRAITFDEGDGRDPYICESDEVVLAALPGGGRDRRGQPGGARSPRDGEPRALRRRMAVSGADAGCQGSAEAPDG